MLSKINPHDLGIVGIRVMPKVGVEGRSQSAMKTMSMGLT